MVFKFYAKPRDRSLKAFKEWFQGYRLPGLNSANDVATRYWMEEGQWITYWKLFWAKVDGSSNQQAPPNN